MKKVKEFTMLIAISTMALVSCDKDDDYDTPPAQEVESTVFKASGDTATINPQLNAFRSVLGDPVNGTPGVQGGRREVNWEGVPPAFNNNNNFPLDFFGSTDPSLPDGRKRGLVYLNNGSPIRVDSTKFIELDSSFADEFTPFSGKRAVISANSNESEIVFKLAGTNTPAFVKGFGIVFLDVDDANSTALEFFNGSKSLGVFKAPVRTGAGSFSFLGVHFPQEKITRIKIIAGNAPLTAGVKDVSDGGNKDLVAFDDFFYDEPQVSN